MAESAQLRYFKTERGRAAKQRAAKKYRESEKGRRAELGYRIKRDYGLTLEQYDALSDQQDGKCAICRGPIECVDHCHTSGQVRGLLCNPCNLGLGIFKDDPERLAAAIEYLQGV